MSGQKPRKKAKVGGDASTAVPASRSNPARSSTRPRALFIAVYNFKGGCGKTFVTRELAATAAKGGRRVGMVDADPQCNLTSWWLPSSDPYMGVGADSTRRHLEDAEEPDKDSGHHWVGPAEHVNQGDIAVQQYMLHTQAEPLNIVDYRSDNLPNNLFLVLRKAMQNPEPFLSSGLDLTRIPSPPAGGNGGLWLLPGSRQTLQFEPVLGSAQHRQDATGTQSHYTGTFRAVLEKMSRQAQLDIIFVDCSPSCGPLNKAVVMSCDYILAPSMVDTSNLSSLHGLLTAVLPAWAQEHIRIVGEQYLEPLRTSVQDIRNDKRDLGWQPGPTCCDVDIYSLPEAPPRLLPVVALNFGLRSQNGVPRVMLAKSRWILQIRTLFAHVKHMAEEPLSADPPPTPEDRHHHDGLDMVVRNMLPERHGNGNETHYVWAMVRTLDKPLTQSGLNRWPVTWSVEQPDISFFLSNAVQRVERHELPTSNDKNICKDVLVRMRTLVDWIMALP